MTATAQTGTNIGTAIANSYLNNVNQVGPDGSVGYSIDGYQTYTDPLDPTKTYQIPKYTQTTTLSEQGQALQGINDQTDTNLATLARDQSGKLQGLLGAPVNLNNESTEARLWELGTARLDPRFDRQRDDLATRLSNQGIKLGSSAYDRAMSEFGQTENDAYNQLLLTGRGQAAQELLQERNQPINEITALMSGSQVAMPQFGATNNYGIPTTDYAGIQSNYDNQRMNAWQQNNANRQNLLGGLFSFGASMLSDRRAKKNIRRVGKAGKLNVYKYQYKAGGPTQIGLMAQEVAKVKPDAVSRTPSGLFAVDYEKALA